MTNGKNRIKEFLEARGLPQTCVQYRSTPCVTGGWESSATLTLPGYSPITGTGTAGRIRQAEVLAAQQVVAQMEELFAVEPHDWEPIYAEAQAGDALLKLAGYLSTSLATREERSWWLQVHESDAALARVFDFWRAQGAPELTMYGPWLGEKLKATVVEAVIWRRYGGRVFGPGAVEALSELREALTARTSPSPSS